MEVRPLDLHDERIVEAQYWGRFFRGLRPRKRVDLSPLHDTLNVRNVDDQVFQRGGWQNIYKNVDEAWNLSPQRPHTLGNFVDDAFSTHFPGNPAAREIGASAGKSITQRLSSRPDDSILKRIQVVNSQGGTDDLLSVIKNPTFADLMELQQAGKLRVVAGHEDRVNGALDAVRKGVAGDVNDALVRANFMADKMNLGPDAKAKVLGPLRRKLLGAGLGVAAVGAAGAALLMKKPPADASAAADNIEGAFTDPYDASKAGNAEGHGEVEEYEAKKKPFGGQPKLDSTQTDYSPYLAPSDPMATRTSDAAKLLKRFAKEMPANSGPVEDAQPQKGAASPEEAKLHHAAKSLQSASVPSFEELVEQVNHVIGGDFENLSDAKKDARLNDPNVRQKLQRLTDQFLSASNEARQYADGLDFGDQAPATPEIKLSFIHPEAAFLKEAGLSDTIFKTLSKGATAIGLGNAAKTVTDLLAPSVGAAEQALTSEKHGRGGNMADPKIFSELKDVDDMSKNMQLGDGASAAMGVPHAFKDLATALQRNSVPPVTIGKYVKELAPLAQSAAGNPSDFMEVAAAAMAHSRGMADGDERVAQAYRIVKPIVDLSNRKPSHDILGAAAGAIRGDASYANRLMLASAPKAMTGGGDDVWPALNAIFQLVTPNNLMRAHMSQLGRDRDQMITDQQGFFIGVAGLKSNFARIYYSNMAKFYSHLREQLGPFASKPWVKNLIAAAVQASEWLSKAQSIKATTGLGPRALAYDAVTTVRTAQADRYAPTEIEDPSSTKSYHGGSKTPLAPFESESAMNQRQRGIDPHGNANPPNMSEIRQLQLHIPDAKKRVEEQLEVTNKQIATLQGSYQATFTANRSGLGTAPAMSFGNIMNVATQVRLSIDQAEKRINEWVNLNKRYFELTKGGDLPQDAPYAAHIEVMNAIAQYQTLAEAHRATLKGKKELIDEMEKVLDTEMSLSTLEVKRAEQQAIITDIMENNQDAKVEPTRGLTHPRVERQVDPETGAESLVQREAPARVMESILQQEMQLIAGLQQSYSKALTVARSYNLSNFIRLYEHRLSELKTKITQLRLETNRYKRMLAKGRMPSGGFGNVVPQMGGRGAADSSGLFRLASEETTDRVFDFWRELLGDDYASAMELAGHGLGSETVQGAGRKKRFRRD
jgi:hypothetical protein